MLRRLDSADPGFEAQLRALEAGDEGEDAIVAAQVAQILGAVRERGDAALLEYTATFDGYRVTEAAALELPAARLQAALAGLDAARRAGLTIKINAVALKGVNDDELSAMLAWCGDQGFDMTIIEVMPMGEIGTARLDQYLPLPMVRTRLKADWTLRPIDYRTGGPARYVEVAETGRKLGFITPLTHNFCEGCNRVRLTCTGQLYMCLGQADKVDLRAPVRAAEGDGPLEQAILEAISRKLRGHDFVIDRRQAQPVERHMSVTGG